jgi:peptidoglycan/LPS O-acetylase OafA/YrhL
MSHPTGKVERGGFFWADVLRFVAALLVVMEHGRDLLFLTLGEVGGLILPWKLFYFVTGFGSEAVIVFFVLSGFWITSAVTRRIDQADFWRTYLIDRLSRLLIVVVPVLLIGGALDLASIHLLASRYVDGSSGALTVQEPVADSLGFMTLVGNLLFLQKLVFPTFGSNGPLWSLAYEFWYYIWFPSPLLLVTRRKLSIGLLALGLGALSFALVEGFAVWMMGSALYYLDRRWLRAGENEGERSGWRAWSALGGALLLLAAALTASRLTVPFAGGPLVLGAAFSLFFWVLLRTNPRPRGTARPLARFGSEASFSLYAIHFPLILVLASIIPPGLRASPDAGRLGAWFGLVAAAVASAWLFSRLTEARTADLRAWLRRTVPGGG